MSNGRVKWFNAVKGFGFIVKDPDGPDIFVHFSNIIMQGYKGLLQGQIVEFDLYETEKGLEAKNVKVIS